MSIINYARPNTVVAIGHRAVAAGIYIARLLVPPQARVTPATTRSIKLVLLK